VEPDAVILRVLVLFAAVEPLIAPVLLAQNEAQITPAMASPVDLDWSAPEGCPDREAVLVEVLKLAGAKAASAHHLKAHATIRAAEGTGFFLSLLTELEGVKGGRTLSGVSCESLSDAAALMLALILNPEVATKALPAAPAEKPAEEPAPSAATIATAEHHRPGARTTWLVGAHGGAQVGVLEDLSPSIALSLGIGLGRFAMRLVPTFTPPQKIYAEAGLGGRLWTVGGAAFGCWATPLTWPVLTPCLGLEVTWLQGRGLGVMHSRDASVYWVSGELALFAGLPLGRGLMLEVGAIGLLPFSRPSVYLEDGQTPVSRPAVLGFKALGGLAWRFD
jgi:hypothetical protein